MECPVCCELLDQADLLYDLRCPTQTCEFNMCSKCVSDFQKSAADGYQMASDGSRQVKIQVQCPQCRSKYECKKYPGSIILPAILLLRQASRLDEAARESDSNLTAKILARKDEFTQTCSIEQLEDASNRVATYLNEIQRNGDWPEIDLQVWKNVLPEKSATGSSDPTHSGNSIDPTLLCGLGEFMSRDEQVFVCERMTSGLPDGLVQGAQILQSMLELTALGMATIQSDPDPDIHDLRKRHKLPARMPRYVHLPHYDPDRPQKSLKFVGKNSLVLSSVRGPAGKLGLRKNDVVTHFQGEQVGDYTMFVNRMQAAFHEFPEGTSPICVNADMETAVNLQKRKKVVHAFLNGKSEARRHGAQ